MSGYNNQSDSYDDDNLDRQDSATGGGLRKQLEKALEKIDKLQRDLDGQKQEDAAVEVLKDKGLDPALKELIPADANPAEWVEKYAHLLGVKGKEREVEAAPGDDPEIVALAQEEEDAAVTLEREARAQIQSAADAGSSARLTGDVLERMDKIDSEEELLKFFQSNGAVGG